MPVRGGYFTASSAEKEVSLGSQKPRNTACCCMARKSEQLVVATQLRHRSAAGEEEIGGLRALELSPGSLELFILRGLEIA